MPSEETGDATACSSKVPRNCPTTVVAGINVHNHDDDDVGLLAPAWASSLFLTVPSEQQEDGLTSGSVSLVVAATCGTEREATSAREDAVSSGVAAKRPSQPPSPIQAIA